MTVLKVNEMREKYDEYKNPSNEINSDNFFANLRNEFPEVYKEKHPKHFKKVDTIKTSKMTSGSPYKPTMAERKRNQYQKLHNIIALLEGFLKAKHENDDSLNLKQSHGLFLKQEVGSRSIPILIPNQYDNLKEQLIQLYIIARESQKNRSRSIGKDLTLTDMAKAAQGIAETVLFLLKCRAPKLFEQLKNDTSPEQVYSTASSDNETKSMAMLNLHGAVNKMNDAMLGFVRVDKSFRLSHSGMFAPALSPTSAVAAPTVPAPADGTASEAGSAAAGAGAALDDGTASEAGSDAAAGSTPSMSSRS